MVRSSNHIPAGHPEAAALVAAIKAFQDAVDRFDTAAAADLGINDTDLRCLTLLHDQGPRRPSELAACLGLTRGATTTALARLEAAGYLARASNRLDARSHFVQLTPTAQRRLDALWQPLRARGTTHLAGYAVAELRLLRTFMERSMALHEACREELAGPEGRG